MSLTPVITPTEAKDRTGYVCKFDEDGVRRIIDHVNDSLHMRRFHYVTAKNDPFFTIKISHVKGVSAASKDEALRRIRDAGWDATYHDAYCGHGPFQAILIASRDFGPSNVEFSTVE